MNTTLKDKLREWDGKHMDLLHAVYHEVLRKNLLTDVLTLYNDEPGLRPATSWLIKHYVDEGHFLAGESYNRILNWLPQLENWEAQLHILQLIPLCGLPADQAKNLEAILRQLTGSSNKFVRAAAYEAYYEVVKNVPALEKEFKARCKSALDRESASVRVKIRRILKKISI